MNGGEKDEMLAVLGEIFIGTGLAVKDIDKIFDFDFTTHTQLSKGR